MIGRKPNISREQKIKYIVSAKMACDFDGTFLLNRNLGVSDINTIDDLYLDVLARGILQNTN